MKTVLYILGLILILASCKSPSYLPKPKEFKDHVKGLYFDVKLKNKTELFGEIIEVSENEMKIIPLNGEKILSIPKEEIKSGDIVISLTSDNPKKVATRAAISTLSTAAHGWWMVFSFPINLITSVSNAQSAAKGTYRIKYPDNIMWTDISRFARFPQGIPDDIDVSLIR